MSWIAIIRLGLVQSALGSVVVLITSTLNRVMVVEYALPALLPGALVALHYGVQMLRPRFGFGSDVGGRRTPWILGGMAVLVCGGVLCALATITLPGNFVLGLGLAVAAYTLVGLGVGAAGTSLLVLVADQVDDRRRAAAATIMWVLMVAGFAITATAVGHFLDPFSPRRLLFVTAAAAGAAFLVAALAVFGVERPSRPAHPANARVASAMGRAAAGRAPAGQSFQAALRQVWAEPQARGFTLFVFVSMLAYSAQELILEPFAGLVFGYTLGESSKLSGLQHGAVFLGMVTVGLAGSVTVRGARRFGSLRAWTIGGCLASALALLAMAGADVAGPAWPLRTCVAALGFSNGVFAVAAIGSMMELSGAGGAGRAGVRMGLWGAAQAVAFALGGLFGTSIVDSVRFLSGAPTLAFGIVFSAEAALFLLAAGFAAQVDSPNKRGSTADSTAVTI